MAGRSCPPLGLMLSSLREAERLGLLDAIVVVGSERAPEGADLATAAGVEWIDEADLLAELGPVRGKGDAMWRALSRIDTDLVLFLDGDNEDFGLHFVCGLLGPLLGPDPAQFVKATYTRQFTAGSIPDSAVNWRV